MLKIDISGEGKKKNSLLVGLGGLIRAVKNINK